MKFGMQVEVDKWRTMVCRLQYDPIQGQGQVTSRSNLEIFPFSNAISSAIYSGSWQLTTDSWTRAQYLNILGPVFWYLV